jgi:hypothetical protein
LRSDTACDGGGEARFSEDHMTANAFGRAAMSQHHYGLIVLVPIPTLGKEPATKTFLDEIYRLAGSSRRSYLPLTAFTPLRWRTASSSIEAWPLERTKRSRFGQIGSSGSKRRKFCQSV